MLPSAVQAPQPTDGEHPSGESCSGPFRDPDGLQAATTGTTSAPFQAEDDGATTSVKEWLTSWTGLEQIFGPPAFDLVSACGPAPSGEAWEAVTLSHAGDDVPAVVRHPRETPVGGWCG